MHAACNIITGEVITCSRGRALKRRIAKIERWNKANGYGRGEWVFAHGAQWGNILGAKYNDILAQRGLTAW